jgi:hypothetical protein
LVIDLTKTGAVDALPLCGLIEAAVKMFIEINVLDENPILINSDHIALIEYIKTIDRYMISLDLVAGMYTEKFDRCEYSWKEEKEFHYKEIHFITKEEYDRIKEKLLAE